MFHPVSFLLYVYELKDICLATMISAGAYGCIRDLICYVIIYSGGLMLCAIHVTTTLGASYSIMLLMLLVKIDYDVIYHLDLVQICILV